MRSRNDLQAEFQPIPRLTGLTIFKAVSPRLRSFMLITLFTGNDSIYPQGRHHLTTAPTLASTLVLFIAQVHA